MRDETTGFRGVRTTSPALARARVVWAASAPARAAAQHAHARAVALREAARLGLDLAELTATTERGRLMRGASLSAARRMLWAAMREQGVSYPEIARATGAASHTSVMQALRRHAREVAR